ncbi:MAG: hypothetical protein ACRET4_13935 [Steroidobacteraceae bacterium]
MTNGNDADSLAAAAVLLWESDDNIALSLLARSTALAPDRPEYAWLQLEACARSTTCDVQPQAARLLSLAPDNGAAAMVVLSIADKANDEAARASALAQLAHAERVDVYWTTLISRLGPPAAATRKMTLLEAVVAVTGKLVAIAIPAYSSFSSQCKGDRLHDEKVVENCRAAARAMLRGDTYVTEMIGIVVSKRVWPEKSPEWKAAFEARRRYSYQSRIGFDFNCCNPHDAAGTKEYLRLLALYPREQDLLKAQITAHGLDPDPPEDWVDPSQK